MNFPKKSVIHKKIEKQEKGLKQLSDPPKRIIVGWQWQARRASRPFCHFSLHFAILACVLPFQLVFCRFSLRFAVLARVLPFQLAFCRFSLHFAIQLAFCYLACFLLAISLFHHHHPNFYDFFLRAIAPLTGLNSNYCEIESNIRTHINQLST